MNNQINHKQKNFHNLLSPFSPCKQGEKGEQQGEKGEQREQGEPQGEPRTKKTCAQKQKS